MTARSGVALAIVLAVGFSSAAGVRAQEDPGVPPTPIAIVLRIATGSILELDGRPEESAQRRLADLAGALEAWREPDPGLPLALAVSPTLCDELDLLRTPEARRVLDLMRTLARRSDVLTAPYADVRLPYLRRRDEIREALAQGARTLRECLDHTPIDVLIPPGLALDEHVVNAAGDRGIDESISDLAATAVRSRATENHGSITLIPPVEPSTFSSGPKSGALVVDADEPSWASTIATAAAAGSIEAVPIAQLGRRAPEVFVEFPGIPVPADGRRRAIDRARRALESFEDYTLADNELGRRLRVAYARALATTSNEWSQELNQTGASNLTRGQRAAARLVDEIRDEERKLTTAGEPVTFTSRRGSFGVTVTNAADYPVRVRVAVSSPKLDFPDGSSRVVTVEPPGGAITFAAITRSTGTFPTLITLTSPDRSLVFDRGELSVRSTAVNFSAIVLTAGGAIFLLGWLARRRARRRSSTS